MQTGKPQLSIIIPTLDEAVSLPGLLNQLAGQRGIELEVIVADGGSCDGTQQIVRDYGGKLLETPPGRGLQMNRAAVQAKAPVLLFLHADSALTADTQLREALKAWRERKQRLGHDRLAGHFRLRFHRSRPGNDLAYRYYEEKSALNRSECTNGDQGFFLGKRFFGELHGFDESLWFLEDQRLAETIRRRGCWMTLPGLLETSARRFEEEGLGRRLLLSALIMNMHAIRLDEFFLRADGIYRQQDRTGRLRLRPVFNLIHALNREAGGRVSRQRWLATGKYVAGHAWQPFFWLDLALEYRFRKDNRLLLPFYDRFLEPLTGLQLVHILSAGITWLWFTTYRWWLNRRES